MGKGLGKMGRIHIHFYSELRDFDLVEIGRMTCYVGFAV